jgi:hypothetical protein
MKKFLTVIVLCILFLSCFRAFAIPQEKHYEKYNSGMPEFSLEIKIEGGLFGYTCTILNAGSEQIIGNLTIEIRTVAMFAIVGEILSHVIELDLNPITGVETFSMKPFIGFGSATISFSGMFDNEHNQYPIDMETSGYAFVIFIICDETTINLP